MDVATPVPTGELGVVALTTEPGAAYVKVDGELKGVTPTDIELPIGQPVNLLVYKVGFKSHHEPEFVLGASEDTLDIVLKAE
jgi:hypothetical protein